MKRLCVLLPAKDEAVGIGKTLKSILRAGLLPSDVYVIDDGSSDGTGDIARAFGVNVVRNPKNIGKAHSLARLASVSELLRRYDYICLMDADTQVSGDYFRAIRKSFAEPGVAVVCGRAKSTPHNWLTAYRCLAYWISHAIYKDGQSNMGVITVTPGCAAAFRADAFGRLEWSSDTIVEDMDCTIQVHRKKLGRIIYQKRAVVSTQDPRTLRDYVKQMYRWHTGAWQVGRKYGMLTGLSKIDLEYKLLMGEGVVFATLFLLVPLWLLLYSRIAVYAVGMDLIVLVFLSLMCAICDRRMDVLLFSPLYPLLRTVDCSVFLYSFWKVVIQRKQVRGWFAVKRY
ncbi:MAG TPA: glycosyltransferase family 2 protein [Terriglobales bacterium]|nr:glycosyltransferase family 2 protein [Terriglobales bacterium]